MLARVRSWALAGAVLCVPSGFLVKFYEGPGAYWTGRYGAAVVYEIFWILFVFGLVPAKANARRIPWGVFAATCLLEILQLWRPLWLQSVRAHFWGRTLLGTDFDLLDFPHYALGCILGGALAAKIWAQNGS